MKLWVGVDWGHSRCGIAVESEGNQTVETFFVEVNEPALAKLCARLTELADGDEIVVGIERATGRVVNHLVEAGFQVLCINPKQVDRGRGLLGMSTAKDDLRDAVVLARLLRTMPDIFTAVESRHPVMVQLKATNRFRTKLTRRRVSLANRVTELLRSSFPALLEVVVPTAKAFVHVWRRVPSHEAALTLRPAQLKSTFSKARIRRIGAKEALKLLREPAPVQAPGEAEVHQLELRLLVDQLELLNQQLDHVGRLLDEQLEALHIEERDAGIAPTTVEVTRSMKGVGRVVTATLIAEGVTALLPDNLEAARGICGVAPVTRTTGRRQQRKEGPSIRRECNKHLRAAMHSWSSAAIQKDERSKERYAAMRARGHTHGRACRQLADQNLKVLRAMLRDRTLYGEQTDATRGLTDR